MLLAEISLSTGSWIVIGLAAVIVLAFVFWPRSPEPVGNDLETSWDDEEENRSVISPRPASRTTPPGATKPPPAYGGGVPNRPGPPRDKGDSLGNKAGKNNPHRNLLDSDDDIPAYRPSPLDSGIDLGGAIADVAVTAAEAVTEPAPDPAPFGSHFDVSEPAGTKHAPPTFASDLLPDHYKTPAPVIAPTHGSHEVKTPEIKPETDHGHSHGRSDWSSHHDTGKHHDTGNSHSHSDPSPSHHDPSPSHSDHSSSHSDHSSSHDSGSSSYDSGSSSYDSGSSSYDSGSSGGGDW